MAWGVRFFGLAVLIGLLWLLFQPASEPAQTVKHHPIAAAPTVVSLNATAPVRVTVYQDHSGAAPSYSDRIDRGEPHVLDYREQNSYQSTYRGEVPNTASATYSPAEPSLDPIQQLRQDNAILQQQVQAVKQQRFQAVMGE